jgi:putative ABC transport system ATP-binding protein
VVRRVKRAIGLWTVVFFLTVVFLIWQKVSGPTYEVRFNTELADRATHLPNELSGGQQQRVAIARALVTDPALLLADEPTGNLDTRTSIEVLALFRALNDQGLTVVMVTHEPDIARYVKRVVELRDGRVVRDDAVSTRCRAADDLAARDAAARSGGAA